MKLEEFGCLKIFIFVIVVTSCCLGRSYLGHSCFKQWGYHRKWCWQRFNNTDYCEAVETCRFFGSQLANNESYFVKNSTSRHWVYTANITKSLTNVSCPVAGKNLHVSKANCPVGSGNGTTTLSKCNSTLKYICNFIGSPAEVGLQSGRVADFQMSSSSIFHTTWEPINYHTRFGRLHYTYTPGTATQGGWCSQNTSGLEYIQVRFNRTMIVTGLALQGVNTRQCNLWVTFFNVSYKEFGNKWMKYNDSSVGRIFVGNKNANQAKDLKFSMPFAAREIRVYPVGFGSTCRFSQNRYCLRLEIYALHTKVFSDSMIHLYSRFSDTTPKKKTIRRSLAIIQEFKKVWPTGSYALPKPISGCALSLKTEWYQGYRLHDGVTSMKIDNLAKSNSTQLRNSISPFYFVEEFCTKKERMINSRSFQPFPPGKYCIYQVDAVCPQGFQNGSLRFFENETRTNRTGSHLKGAVPKHRVNFNTSHESCCFIQIYYCCRNDTGSRVLDLPSSMPFFLIPKTNACPDVRNANVIMEAIEFSTYGRLNNTRKIAFGVHPFIRIFKLPTGAVTMRYYLCYYKPIVNSATVLKVQLRVANRSINTNFPCSIAILLLMNGSLVEYGNFSSIWYNLTLSANCTSFSTEKRIKSVNGIGFYNGSFYLSPHCSGVVNATVHFQGTVPAKGAVTGKMNLTLFSRINILIVLRNRDFLRLKSLTKDLMQLKRRLESGRNTTNREVNFKVISYKTKREIVKKLKDSMVYRTEDPRQIHGIAGFNIDEEQIIVSSFSRVHDVPFIIGNPVPSQAHFSNKLFLQFNLSESKSYRTLSIMKQIKANQIMIIRSEKLKIPVIFAYNLLNLSITVRADVIIGDKESSSTIARKLREVGKNFTTVYFMIDAHTASNVFIAAMKVLVSPRDGYLWISGSKNGVFEQGIGSKACYKHKPFSCGNAFQGVYMIDGFQTVGPLNAFFDGGKRKLNLVTLKKMKFYKDLIRYYVLDGAEAIAKGIARVSRDNLTITTARILAAMTKVIPSTIQNFRLHNSTLGLPTIVSIKCLRGWSGTRCSYPQCLNHHCVSKRGVCVGDRQCECFSGFYGRSCSGVCEDVCKNGICNEGARGDGSCISCHWLYEGKYCDKGTLIQALVSGCIGFLVLVVVIVWYLPNCLCTKHYDLKNGELDESDWIIQWIELENRKKVSLDRNVLGGQLCEKFRYTSYFKAKFQHKDVFVKSIKKRPVKLSLEVRMEIKKVKDLDHANIEKVKAVCLGPPYVAIITELASMGSLYDTLHVESVEIPVEIKYALMEDISRGMLFLHEECGMPHGRLKSTNCLIHRGWQLKITDIGLGSLRKNGESGNYSMFYGNSSYTSGIEKQDAVKADYNSLLWTAPEYLGPGIVNLDQVENVNFEGDVYSFGIIIVEILTRRPPYGEIKVMTTKHIIEAVAHLKEPMVDLELIRPGSPRAGKNVMAKEAKILRPSIRGDHLPEYEPKKNMLRVLIESLWSDNPENRPLFSHITTVLRKISPLKGDKMEKKAFLFEKEAELLERYIAQDTRLIDKERDKINEYLTRSLPWDIYNEIEEGEDIDPVVSNDISVAAFRLQDFQNIVNRSSPDELVCLIDYIIKSFQAVAVEYAVDVTEINVMSDICIVVEGPSEIAIDGLLKCCIKMLQITKGLDVAFNPALDIKLSAALNSGSGVTGLTHEMDNVPRYRVVSKVVDTTLMMLDKSSPSCILVTDTFATLIKDKDNVSFIHISTKCTTTGKNTRTYWLASI